MAKGNSFSLRGNVVADSVQEGNGPVKFSVAWNQSRKLENGEWESTPHYFDVICWDRDVALDKGTAVLLDGFITQQRWQNAEGQNRYKVELVAQEVAVVPRKDKPAEAPESTPVPEEIPF